jgi:hypothetical protein
MFINLGAQFWNQAGERAVKTAIQVFVAVLSVGHVGIFNAPWTTAFSTAAMAALLSVLTSLVSEPVGQRRTPSIVGDSSDSGSPTAMQKVNVAS